MCLDTLVKTTISCKPRLTELMRASNTLSAALYKQKITAVLSDRVRSILKSFGAATDAAPVAAQTPPTRKKSEEPTPVKRVFNLVPCTGKDDAKAQSFVRVGVMDRIR